MNTEVILELIRERIAEKPLKTRWMNESNKNPFFGESRTCSLLPHKCGEHKEYVYNSMGINCNTVWFNHFRLGECLTLNGLVAMNIYLVVGECCVDDNEVGKHIGEIYVEFARPVNCGGEGEIYLSDYGTKDIRLEELADTNPDFVKNLVFNLR